MLNILWNMKGLVIFILSMKDIGKISPYLYITKYNKTWMVFIFPGNYYILCSKKTPLCYQWVESFSQEAMQLELIIMHFSAQVGFLW